jgi:uncharacterized protein (DUF58 family)
MSRHSRKEKSRLRFRTATFVFFGIFLLCEVAAFNTGENMLYLLAAFVLGFPLLAIVVSNAAFRGLELQREAPDAVHRNEPFTVSVRLNNRKRVLPAASLSVAFAGEDAASAVYLPVIAPRTSATLHMSRIMPRRGVHALPDLRLSSAFPMGLIERSLLRADGLEVVVYPRVHRLDRAALEHLDDSGNRPRPTFATGDEFYALREYVPGDDIRLICWRVSARLGELIVRELEPGSARSIAIVLDARGVPGTLEAEERFELAIELAASLAVAFLDRQYSVALITPQGSAPLSQGEGHVLRVLNLLAHVSPVAYESLGDDWFLATGDLAGATRICVATDSARWGGPGLGGGVRVLDPEELLHAS